MDQLKKRSDFEENKIKNNLSFILHDIFDTKSFMPEKVSVIKDENLQMELKSIIEDHMNRKRTEYYK